MIGESIECKKGMEGTWEAICKDHVKSIIDQFDEMSIYNLKQSQLEQLCPLHPMTLTMLTRVADNFAASSRTLFSFMKDTEKAESSVGFIHYIENNGPDDWRWLTVDYLWDYFSRKDQIYETSALKQEERINYTNRRRILLREMDQTMSFVYLKRHY